jgi:hypothetical protein
MGQAGRELLTGQMGPGLAPACPAKRTRTSQLTLAAIWPDD